MNLKRYDRDYRGDLIPRAEGPLCLYSEVHDMSEALTLACAERDALLAECETLRRKAAVCDDLLRAYSRLVNGTIMADSFACEAMRIAKTAIEAALAAKESK